MGDADPRAQHYSPYAELWNAQATDRAFPPYWFLTDQNGKDILHQQLNVNSATGVHVPIKVPADLAASGEDYFTVPGEARGVK